MEERAIEMINTFMSCLTSKFDFHTSPLSQTETNLYFVTEVSLATPTQPFALISVKVYFSLPREFKSIEDARFRFDHETLTHSPHSTLAFHRMESYIETLLDFKAKNRELFFLATDFERPRVPDPRILGLDKPAQIDPPRIRTLSLTDAALARPPRAAKLSREASLLASNRKLADEFRGLALKLFDAQGLGFLDSPRAALLLASLGLSSPGPAELGTQPVVSLCDFAPLLQEVALSRLVFLQLLRSRRAAESTLRLRAARLFDEAHASRIEELRKRLVAACGGPPAQRPARVQIEVRRAADSLLLDAEAAALAERIEKASHEMVTPETVLTWIRQAKVERMIAEQNANRLSEFDLLLSGPGEVDFQAFQTHLEAQPVLSVTPLQLKLFWSFIKHAGFVRFDKALFKQILPLFTKYIRFIIVNKDLLVPGPHPAPDKWPSPGNFSSIVSIEDFFDQIKKSFELLLLEPPAVETMYQELKQTEQQTPLTISLADKLLLLEQELQRCVKHFVQIN